MWDDGIDEAWESAPMEMNESLSVGISKSKISLMKLIICPYVCKIKKSKPKFGCFFQGNGIFDIQWSSMQNLKIFLQNMYKISKGENSS